MENNKEQFYIDEYIKKVFDIEFEECGVDLRLCFRGDKLICKDGFVIYYVQFMLLEFLYEYEIVVKEDLKVMGIRIY